MVILIEVDEDVWINPETVEKVWRDYEGGPVYIRYRDGTVDDAGTTDLAKIVNKLNRRKSDE